MRSVTCGVRLRAWSALILVVGVCSQSAAGVVIDGNLDEPAWSDAPVYDNFKVTDPFSLRVPDAGAGTKAQLISTPEGIVVGFTIAQGPAIPRVKPRLGRDQWDAADTVTFMIDFDADGRTAYSFTVGLSGSIRDGVVSNENDLNLDWDTAWTWAVSEDETGWQAEMLIPWTVAPMRGTDSPVRNVAVYFSRTLGSTAHRQAFPAVSRSRGQFISGFERIEIAQYRKALFHYWPYLTASHDLIDGQTDYKMGADVFWKPSANFQLTGTINPDFGQVESDALVVNFDAAEVFFSDKRPFFTENQSIFNLRTPDSGQLVHTRRIGGEADDGTGASDINAAIKLNGSFDTLAYGVLAAIEDGPAGRDFYAARLQYPMSRDLSVGWLGTQTERPYLDRSAQVQAFDMRWSPMESLIVNGQVLGSFINQHGTSTHGSGAWVRADWAPSASWNYELEATHFGNQLNFNDLGYQRRASLNEVEVTGNYIHRVEDQSSWLSSSQWSMELQARSNDHGDHLPSWLLFGNSYNLRSGNTLYIEASLSSSGWDDRISRGHGLWRQPGRYGAEIGFDSARLGNWAFGTEFRLRPQGLSATPGQAAELSVTWYPSDAFNAHFEFGPEWTDDWLIWEGERNFGRYPQRVDYAALDMNWFPGQKHELRLKTEWLAIQAGAGLRYELQTFGKMLQTGDTVPAFDINTFGLQLRYRYLLGPQSDIFLAYSRGGFRRQDRDGIDGMDLFDEALDLRDSDQLFAKIRYRF